MKILLIALLLTVFCVSAAAEGTEFTSGDYTYVLLEDGTAEITGFSSENEVVEIPAELDGHPVTSIGNKAFDFNLHVQSVVVPEGVTNIGERSFSRCLSLTSITLPESLTTIGVKAFSECMIIEELVIPNNVKVIEEETFYRCKALKSLTLPEGLESIAGFVFYETEALLELTIPASVNDINEDAFMYYAEDMVLTVAPDSYAQQWAAENEFAYIVAEPVAEAAN